MEQKDVFRARLESRFPDLRLCDSHWKADALAVSVFSNWKGSKRGKAYVQKLEEGGDSEEVEVVSEPAQSRSASVAVTMSNGIAGALREDEGDVGSFCGSCAAAEGSVFYADGVRCLAHVAGSTFFI